MTPESISLHKGRPADTDRIPSELRCYDVLDSLGIEYMRADHPHADTIEDCLEIEKVLGHPICKNLFLTNRNKTDHYLLLMPGDKPFKTKELSAQIGTARLSFANEEKMLEYLDIKPGSVSVMGLMNDKDRAVQLLVDEDLLRSEWLGCHPCVKDRKSVV